MMTEDRLEGLALISIEHEIASSLDYATLMDSCSPIEARQIAFNCVILCVLILL